jgi:sulfur-carrier protein adenylyltransferase/sulfurtransferase
MNINAEKLWELYQTEDALLVDLRELKEVPSLNPEIFYRAPMSDFNNFLAVEFKQRHVILLCQHGIRSVAAAELLKEKYGNEKEVYNLKGGIVKWKKELIDKTS